MFWKLVCGKFTLLKKFRGYHQPQKLISVKILHTKFFHAKISRYMVCIYLLRLDMEYHLKWDTIKTKHLNTLTFCQQRLTQWGLKNSKNVISNYRTRQILSITQNVNLEATVSIHVKHSCCVCMYVRLCVCDYVFHSLHTYVVQLHLWYEATHFLAGGAYYFKGLYVLLCVLKACTYIHTYILKTLSSPLSFTHRLVCFCKIYLRPGYWCTGGRLQHWAPSASCSQRDRWHSFPNCSERPPLPATRPGMQSLEWWCSPIGKWVDRRECWRQGHTGGWRTGKAKELFCTDTAGTDWGRVRLQEGTQFLGWRRTDRSVSDWWRGRSTFQAMADTLHRTKTDHTWDFHRSWLKKHSKNKSGHENTFSYQESILSGLFKSVSKSSKLFKN